MIIYNVRDIFRLILRITHIQPPPVELIDLFNTHNRLVLVYPHTSYWDGMIMLLYLMAYPKTMRDITFLIRPDLLKIPVVGHFLRYKGALHSTPLEIKNGGYIEHLVRYLNSRDRYQFLISPKGTVRKSPWRSGWYYITKQTNSKIACLGFDYIRRQLMVSEIYNMDELPQKDELEKTLKMFMKTTNPCNPQNEEYY